MSLGEKRKLIIRGTQGRCGTGVGLRDASFYPLLPSPFPYAKLYPKAVSLGDFVR